MTELVRSMARHSLFKDHVVVLRSSDQKDFCFVELQGQVRIDIIQFRVFKLYNAHCVDRDPVTQFTKPAEFTNFLKLGGGKQRLRWFRRGELHNNDPVEKHFVHPKNYCSFRSSTALNYLPALILRSKAIKVERSLFDVTFDDFHITPYD